MVAKKRVSALDKFRQEVRHDRTKVTAKENRIKRTTGVDVRGTAADPRKPIDAVTKMTRSELTQYDRELKAFLSRSNGFVAGAGNVPIPKALWLEYKRTEKQYNAIGAEHFDAIKDINIEPMNITIAKREQLMVPNNLRTQGEVTHRPYGHVERVSTKIASAEALEKILNKMKKKLVPGYLESEINAAREQLAGMLTGAGHAQELLDQANTLTDGQFNILWNYTNFATAVSAVYESEKRATRRIAAWEKQAGLPPSGKKGGWNKEEPLDRGMAGVVEGYASDIGKFFSWAKTLPEEGTKRAAPGKTGGGSKTKKNNG